VVTLTGSGGCGKTRLAVEVVGDVGSRFADGACWVDLQATGDGAMMALAGVVAAIAGVYLLLVQGQRLEFDADAVRRRSLIRPGTVAWADVTEVKVTERFERMPVAGSSRRLAGSTLSMGADGRRGRGLRRDQPVVMLSVEHRATGFELTLELNRSDIAQSEALVANLSERGWLPDDVRLSIDAAP
jgi:hypothetical protein